MSRQWVEKPRFSKAEMRRRIQKQIDAIQAVRHFDPNNGYAQVYGDGEEWNRAYGEYDALRRLLEKL